MVFYLLINLLMSRHLIMTWLALNEKAPSASWAKPWLVEKIPLIVVTRLLIWDRTGPFVLYRD